MDLLLKILQGSYAYLVIFLTLIITFLVLSFIWLLLRRIREAHRLVQAPAPVVIAAPMPDVSQFTAGIEAEFREKLAVLEKENAALKKSSEESKGLRDKVKFLESKLLEYEILQEEIGTLSQLKLENEHLKEVLVNARVPAEEQALAARPASPDEGALLPAATTPPLGEPQPPAGMAPAAIFDAPPEPASLRTPPAPATGAETGIATDVTASAGLEGLLQQIDELTSDDPPKP